jgi:threonine aldolase
MAHINDDECGAPEFFTGGAKLFGLPGPMGKIAPSSLKEILPRFPRGGTRMVQAAALSLSQATESGTVYDREEIGVLTEIAHAAGLAVHMDGARFTNALLTLGCTPAEMTWKAGIDVLSFGATKNGALACEAAIFFDPKYAEQIEVQRKRTGHTLSKGRLLGAQMAAYLRNGHWLGLARHANAMAARLAKGLAGVPGARLPWPCQANEVFAILPRNVDAALQAAGAHYYEWDAASLSAGEALGADEVFIRLVCSFETAAADVEEFIAVAQAAGKSVASSPY